MHFSYDDLWPKSFKAFLQNFGIIVYCMGFILFLLTQYVCEGDSFDNDDNGDNDNDDNGDNGDNDNDDNDSFDNDDNDSFDNDNDDNGDNGCRSTCAVTARRMWCVLPVSPSL